MDDSLFFRGVMIYVFSLSVKASEKDKYALRHRKGNLIPQKRHEHIPGLFSWVHILRLAKRLLPDGP